MAVQSERQFWVDSTTTPIHHIESRSADWNGRTHSGGLRDRDAEEDLASLVAAIRALRRNPRVPLVCVGLLASGLGSALAAWTALAAVVLAPFPFSAQEHLYVISKRNLANHAAFVEVSYRDYVVWRQRATALNRVAVIQSVASDVIWRDVVPVRIESRPVSASFFETLGTGAMLGRTFTPEDERPGAVPVVVISYSMWQRLAAPPNVVGRQLHLGEDVSTVVGVMPRGFDYPVGTDLWRPIVPDSSPVFTDPSLGWLLAIARVKPAVSDRFADTELAALASQQASAHAGRQVTWSVVADPLVASVLGTSRRVLSLFSVMTLLLLGLVCASAANLLLAQAVANERELEVRFALGASKWRLLWDHLFSVGAIVIVSLGLSLLLGTWLVELVKRFASAEIPRLADAALTTKTTLLAVAVATSAGALCGMPAAAYIWAKSWSGLSHGSSPSVRRRGWLTAPLAVQIAGAVVLVSQAVLLAISVWHLKQIDVGFDHEDTLAVEVLLDGRDISIEANHRLFSELAARVAAIPAVTNVSVSSHRPLAGLVGDDVWYAKPGQSLEEARHNAQLNVEAVDAHYFETLGMRLVAGRGFLDSDAANAPAVAVLGEGLAAQDWPNGSAIGQRITLPVFDPHWRLTLTIIGVVNDVRQRTLTSATRDLYLPLSQVPARARFLIVRSATDPSGLAPSIRLVVRRFDRALTVGDVQPLGVTVASAIRPNELIATIVMMLAAVATLLSMASIYGIVSRSIAWRRREIGLRRALGSSEGQVWWLVMRQSATVALLAFPAGVAAALVSARFASSLLFGVNPAGLPIYLASALGLSAVMLVAVWGPLRRALRVDPSQALREP